MKRFAIPSLIALLIIVVDQITKFWVKTNMCLYERIEITSWFQIFFTENKGMAFGMSFIGTMFLALFRIVAIVCFTYFFYKAAKNPQKPLGFLITLASIIAGAVGNLIDNLFYGMIFTQSTPTGYAFSTPSKLVDWGEGYGQVLSGKVVDMFYFPLFTWPDYVPFVGGDVFFGAVFNVADAAISVAAVVFILFYHKQLASKVSL
ncbi:MAG: signal peptidase II [Bacteroidaceae bacterium]|nr:signal peptidase II [Bacteroidaceae bacterium]